MSSPLLACLVLVFYEVCSINSMSDKKQVWTILVCIHNFLFHYVSREKPSLYCQIWFFGLLNNGCFFLFEIFDRWHWKSDIEWKKIGKIFRWNFLPTHDNNSYTWHIIGKQCYACHAFIPSLKFYITYPTMTSEKRFQRKSWKHTLIESSWC